MAGWRDCAREDQLWCGGWRLRWKLHLLTTGKQVGGGGLWSIRCNGIDGDLTRRTPDHWTSSNETLWVCFVRCIESTLARDSELLPTAEEDVRRGEESQPGMTMVVGVPIEELAAP